MDVDPEQRFALACALSDPGNPIIAVEPEQYGHARGDLVEGQLRGIGTPYADSLYFTWGLQATAVSTSQGSARDIRVAVLDSGFDLGHPDFNGRNPLARSFVPGAATAQDGFGHGTHAQHGGAGLVQGPQV